MSHLNFLSLAVSIKFCLVTLFDRLVRFPKNSLNETFRDFQSTVNHLLS